MTFRISLWKRLVVSALIILPAAFLGATAVGLIHRMLTSGTQFREGLYVLLPSLALCASFVLFLLGVWGTRIHISDQGITYRPCGILAPRFVSWDEVVAVKWQRNKVSRILLDNGKYVSFSGLKGQEILARMVRNELSEVNTPERWSPESDGFCETFTLSRVVCNVQLVFYSAYALVALALPVFGLFFRREVWGVWTSLLFLSFALVAAMTALHSVRSYRRVRIEVQDDGVRCYDSATGADRSSAVLHFKKRVPWSEIVQVVRYMGGRGGLLLANGQFLPVAGLDREEIFLHLVERKLEALEENGRRSELKRLKRRAVVAFVLATLAFYGALGYAVVTRLR